MKRTNNKIYAHGLNKKMSKSLISNLACPYPPLSDIDDIYDPYTVGKNSNGKYTCKVQGQFYHYKNRPLHNAF